MSKNMTMMRDGCLCLAKHHTVGDIECKKCEYYLFKSKAKDNRILDRIACSHPGLSQGITEAEWIALNINIKPITKEQAKILASALPLIPEKIIFDNWKSMGLIEKPKTAMDELEEFLSRMTVVYEGLLQPTKLEYKSVMEWFDKIKQLFDKVKEEINSRG